MDKVNRFFELKELWKQSAEVDRFSIDRQITELMDSMTDQEVELLAVGVQNDFDNVHQEVAEIKEQLTIRERLGPVLPYLSVSKLSKDYFNKSSSWFYQRLNGNKIHGKVCRFTDKELETLDMALKDISQRLSSLQLV
ncbi:DUF5053 domain-containing protein [uncultured Parabacteroides sp.]|jgi:hypothetical protein|uniref:DUF5053 domain-containing protein n=1 Tax=Parabacteroides sp. ASD2025 TaxID=3415987 RepID=UPI000E849AD8|nr:DUF5053 domain-containing protein [uncultured Parabacteroides sp.]HBN42887.1 DUF5053 domain-containing protein [Parabacteroides distasonis]